VSETVKKGEQIYHAAGCGSCHRVNGEGGTIGPDLSNQGQRGRLREWLTVQIRDPKVHVSDSTMPAITSLSDQQMNELVDYLLSLKTGPSAAGAESAQSDNGKALFHSEGCIACHTISGAGGSMGPNLSDEGTKGRSRQWLNTQIRNPKSHFPNSLMPSFDALSDQQVNYLVDFLLSLGTGGDQSSSQGNSAAKDSPLSSGSSSSKKTPSTYASSSSSGLQQHPEAAGNAPKGRPGQAAYMIGNTKHGGDIFKLKCASCHGPQGTDKVPNPGSDDGFVPALNPIDQDLLNKDPQTFAKNIDMFIQHGSVPSGPNPQFHMLSFGDDHTLTQQQIANLEAYILHLNGVNRAQLINPGMKPVRFFAIVVPAVIVMLLLLGGIYKCLPQGK
jgi:sulfur oxidation c-type cytochrome SoxX